VKKIGLIFREVSENRIRNSLKSANSVFVVKYSGLSSPDLTTLRRYLKNARGEFFVVKNTVAKRALKNSELQPLIKSIEGPCGLVFIKDEPVDASRILINFGKDHEQLKVEGGFLGNQPLDKKDIEMMAKLPSKKVLQLRMVMALNSPIVRCVYVLKNSLRKLLICLDKIKEKKPA
jgi:large subunit ribosomal protein L10